MAPGPIQASVLEILKVKDRVEDFTRAMSYKATVTVGQAWASSIHLQADWFNNLRELLLETPLFLRVCWLKAITGAWCTSTRLHSREHCQCIFGCTDAKDEFRHYLLCPILWQFPREFLRIPEPSICAESRLCMVEPTVDKLRTLAFCHTLYHTCVNDQGCVRSNGEVMPASIVQQRATELCRYVKHLVSSD